MSNHISFIDAARAVSPRWLLKIWEFDALEIHPCTVIGNDSMDNPSARGKSYPVTLG